MNLTLSPYIDQLATWPAAGRHILAQHDGETIVVYQAYKAAIAEWAVAHGQLGGPEFGFSRMSWIKPNFLWMMYRSGWGTKLGQERVLGLRIATRFFDEILGAAIDSKFDPARFPSRDAWQAAVDSSEVRLQWDPDHGPSGAPQPRRAIQLALRGEMLRRFATTELREVLDLSPFVAEQREHAAMGRLDALTTPHETVYRPAAPSLAARLELDDPLR